MRYTESTSCPKRVLTVIAALGLCGVLASRVEAQSTEDRLLEVLTSSASVAERCNACRELQSAGTERSVPALAAC